MPAPVPIQQKAPEVSPAIVSPPKQAALPHYTCDGGIAFDVRFGDDDAQLAFNSRPPETLLRDAGGVTPQQTVYSNTALKAEFGVDPGGRGAKLRFADPPLEANCTRD
ncbi:MAG TPA: hypothetical protein VIE63_04120 [Ramlibacter sp.]